MTGDWRADPVGAALRGEHPLVLARLQSGFATIGASQFLPGYAVLLTADPSADHLTDLDPDRRRDFLVDLALLGEAVETACRGADFRRINYEVLGNASAFLHAHVHPRLCVGARRVSERAGLVLPQGRPERSWARVQRRATRRAPRPDRRRAQATERAGVTGVRS